MAVLTALYVACVAALSVSQAWVLGQPPPREPHYVVAWLGSAGVLMATFAVLYDLSTASFPADMIIAIIAASLAIAAAALWSGARRRSAHVPKGEPFVGRILAVVPVHVAVVLVGGGAAFVLLGFLWIGHIH